MKYEKEYISDCCDALSLTPVDNTMKNHIIGICCACRNKATFSEEYEENNWSI